MGGQRRRGARNIYGALFLVPGERGGAWHGGCVDIIYHILGMLVAGVRTTGACRCFRSLHTHS